MAYNDLSNYYQDIFFYTFKLKMMTITEYENLIPYERDVFDAMFKQYNAELEEQNKIQQSIEEAKARLF